MPEESKAEHRSNILSVWDQSDWTDWSEGMLAYGRYRQTLYQIAKKYRKPLSSIVGAFAALSPNNDYMNNLRSVVSLLEGSNRTSTYGACRDRAQRCLRGEYFLDFTDGMKTRSFFQNIMDPSDPHPVTIDGHAYCIYVNYRMTMKEAVMLRFKYEPVAEDYRQVAKNLNVLPNQLQAVTWFTWKRIHNSVYQPQMNLLRPGNQWRNDIHPDEVKGFGREQIELFS